MADHLLHLEPKTLAPLGVWWLQPDGTVDHDYIVDDPEELDRGRELVADRFATAAAEASSTAASAWTEVLTDLPAKTPYTSWWEVVENPGTDARATLRGAIAEWMAGRFGRSVNASMSTARQRARYGFAATRGRRIASAILHESDPTPMLPDEGERISSRISPYVSGDDSVLAVAVGVHEPAKDAQVVLAYALAATGERQLRLALPAGSEWPTLARLAFLDVDARVWTHVDDEPASLTEVAIPLRSTVLEGHADHIVDGVAALGDREAWVSDLLEWVDAHPELTPAHRSSYLAWQCRGRSVVEIRRSRKGLSVRAGVISDDARYADGVEQETVGPGQPISSLIEAAEVAITQRIDGTDTTHLEHRFQARLAQGDMMARLGLTDMRLEFPALRPGATKPSRGFIDFLAAGANGALHVVETKIGLDPMIALQALDYAVWADAHRAELAPLLGADPSRATEVDFVIMRPQGSPLIDAATRATLSRFPRSIRWRVFEAIGDLDGDLAVERVPLSRVADHRRWANRVHRRVEAAAEHRGDPIERGWYPEPGAGFVPGAEAVGSDLIAAGHAHPYLGHVRSSQRFAINFFGALDGQATASLLTEWFGAMDSARPPALEWVDPDDRLNEATPERPHQTQVDAFLEGTTADGRRVAALVEVKLTETAFGGCSHADLAPPEARTLCTTGAAFGGEPSNCWQLRNRDAGDRRLYDRYLSVDSLQIAECPFRRLNQPMRLAALAGALEADGAYDDVVVALTAPAGHVAIRRAWRDVERLFGSRMKMLDPSAIASLLPAKTAHGLLDLYGVAPSVGDVTEHSEDVLIDRRSPIGWQLQAELMRRHPGVFDLATTHPGGGMYHCLTLSANGDVVADLNLLGSLHVMGRDPDPDIWTRLEHESIADLVDEIEAEWSFDPTTRPNRRGR